MARARLLLLAVLVVACGGSGDEPAAGVRISDEPPGAHCPTGGSRVETSVDGTVTTVYACKGADGTSVTVSPEPAGVRCPSGGVRLDAASGSSYVCAGGGGGGGGGLSVTPEPAGAHCATGGVRLDAGGETSYVCDGASGGAAAVVIAAEPAGAHCAAGGYALHSGGEIHYVCNGVDGSAGAGGSDPDCVDADGDGRWAGCAAYSAEQPGPDCDDGDATRYQLLDGYADQDLDGTTAGGLRHVCSGDALPVEYRAQASGDDCNDGDADVAQSCATCKDADGDGLYAGCDRYLVHDGPDCDDLHALVGAGMPELPDDGLDNDCAGDGDLRAETATGIFVSPAGNDSFPGTRVLPKRSLSAAASAAGPGGRVFAAAGTYVQGTIAASLFGGYAVGNWTARDITGTPTAVVPTSGDGVTTIGSGRVVIDGVRITVVAPSAGVTATSPSTVVTRCAISTGQYGVYSQVSEPSEPGRSLTVIATTIAGTGAALYGIYVPSRARLLAVGNSVSLQGAGTTAAGTRVGIYADHHDQVRAIGNTIDLTSMVFGDERSGITCNDSNVVAIERNVIRVAASTAHGVRLGRAGTAVVRGNLISVGGGDATGLTLGASVVAAVGNVVGDASAVTFTGVSALSTTTGLSAHVELVGNVIHADESAVAIGVRVGSYAEVAAVDDVVWVRGPGAAVQVAGLPSSLELYHDDLVAPPGGCLLDTQQAGGYCAIDVADVNACRSDRTCAGAGGNLSVAPGFVAADDYHLSATSPLIDRGYDPVTGGGLPALDRTRGPLGAASLFTAGMAAVDTDGQRRTGSWDIGIDEVR